VVGRPLAIYLQDHLAGATAGVSLAERVAKSNAEGPGALVLRQVASEIEEDRDTLEKLMSGLGVRRARMKNATAWSLERLARLKPSGRMHASRAYHQLHELESLSLGVAGKLSLWEALGAASGIDVNVDLDALADRARDQRSRIEEQRIAIARAALNSSPDT
jgi:hypothetical protein